MLHASSFRKANSKLQTALREHSRSISKHVLARAVLAMATHLNSEASMRVNLRSRVDMLERRLANYRTALNTLNPEQQKMFRSL